LGTIFFALGIGPCLAISLVIFSSRKWKDIISERNFSY